MPLLKNAKTGELEFVADSQVQQALDAGSHGLAEGHALEVEAIGGRGAVSDPSQLAALQRAGGEDVSAVPSAQAAAEEGAAYESARYDSAGETLAAGLTGAADFATLGGLSAIERATDPADELARSVRQHRTAHTIGQVAGAVATANPSGLGRLAPSSAVSRAARAVGTAGPGAGRAGRAAIKGAGFAAEGAGLGAGMGLAEASIADDPFTLEHIVGSIKTHALLGAAGGAAIYAGGGLVTGAWRQAKKIADVMGKRATVQNEIPEEIAGLDFAGLRARRELEVENLRAAAVPERAELAARIEAWRADQRKAKPWIAVEGFKGTKPRKSKVPAWDSISDDGVTKTVPLKDIEDDLISIPGEIAGRRESIEAALDAKKKLKPVNISVLPDGKLFVDDGRHRLRAYMDRGVKKVRVNFQRGAEGADAGTEPLKQAAPDLAARSTPERDVAWARDSLGSIERTAEQRNALKAYTGTDYQAINRHLREGYGAEADDLLHSDELMHTFTDPATGQSRTMTVGDAVQGLDDLMTRSQLPEEALLFRGLGGKDGFDPRARFRPGEVIDDAGYQSTTLSRQTAEESFSHGERGTLLEIEAGAGQPAAYMSAGQEAELVLPRGTKYRVLSVADDGPRQVVRVRIEKPAASSKTAAKLDLPPELAREFREIGKLTFEADKKLDRLLRNPKRLAQRPWLAEDALQQADTAYDRLQAVAPDLRARMAADAGSSGQREAALDALDDLQERGRQLQAQITALTPEGMGGKWKPASKMLDAIDQAEDVLKSTPKTSLLQEAATGYAMGAMAGLMPGGAVGAAAAYAAPKVARKLTDLVFGRMRRAAVTSGQRTGRAIETFLDVGKKTRPAALPTATAILSQGKLDSPTPPAAAPRKKAAPAARKAKATPLAAAYRARAEEIGRYVALDPDGMIRVTPVGREAIARQLAGVAAVAPILADKLESAFARRIEFIAGKLPKRPDIGMQTGPDTFIPSTLEMRSVARYWAAADDPGGVEQRLAEGTLSPEDAEVYRELYPERLADLTRQVVERLPELRATLPQSRQLSLSILTGLPVHPALEPSILRILQSQHKMEEGTEGGTQAPQAEAQFGSVTAEQPTGAQQRMA